MFVCKMQTGCLVGGVEGGPFMSELMADSLVSSHYDNSTSDSIVDHSFKS